MKYTWKKVWNKYIKKAIAGTLIAAMLIQVLPATAKGAELDTTTFEEPEAELQTGLSDIYEYETYDVGKAGTISVNTYSGYPHIRRTDMTLGGERMPVEIAFYYDYNNETAFNPYGTGWSCIYNQLLIYNSSEERYEYKNENGTWLYFVNSGEQNEDGEEIWTEDTAYGIRDTGSEMYLSAEAEEEDYTKAKVIYDGKTHVFDSLGRLVQISDEYNSITIAYVDETEKIDYIVDPVGRTFLFFYTAGYLNAIYATNKDGERIDYTEIVYRMANGALRGVIYGYKEHNEYLYAGNRITTIIDIDGNGYELAYSKGKVSSVIQKAAIGTSEEEEGAIVTYEYLEDSQTIITSDGSSTHYTFDEWGRTIGCELQQISEDATEYITVYGYNMTYDYLENEDGSITNALIDVEYYDENGVIEEDSSDEDVEEEEAFEESDTETETGSEVEEEYETLYDEYGNVTAEIHSADGLRQETRYAYSSDGNYLLMERDSNFSTRRYLYDTDAGLLTATYDAKACKTNYTYDALRELSSASINVSGLKAIDAEAAEIQLTDGASAMNVSYAYESGRLSAITYGDSVYAFTYDKWGNLLTVTMDDTTLVTYAYGEKAYKGLPKTIIYGASNTAVYYTYNNLDQVSTVGYAEGVTRFEYSYSSDGKLSSIYDKTLETVTEYTETGYKIYKGTLGNVIQLLYEYEGDEENYKEKILEETFQYSMETEEALSWLNVLDEAGADVYSEKTIYDDFERVKQKQTIVGDVVITQNYAYMVSNKVTGDRLRYYSAAYTSSSKYAAIGFNYAYDLNGNIVSIKTSANESGCTTNYQTTYTYDEAGQLTGAYDGAAGIRYAYSYDQHGNLMSKESYSIAEDGTENLLDQTIMEYDGMVLKNSYSSTNGKTQYGYQAGQYLRSAVSSEGIIHYGWSDGRMLNSIRNNSTGLISLYSYNEEGLRSQKILRKNSLIITTDYVWGKNGLAGFTNGEDTVVVLYGSDGMPVGFTLNGESYAYIKNLQGDVLRILDTNGTTVVEYTYDPWGAQTVTGDTELAAINPCSYRCYDYDEESGLYYLQSRYYNPETGRFLNADDTAFLGASGTPLGYNLFAYCCNNPVNNMDPSGFIKINIKWVWIAVDGIIWLIPALFTISKIWKSVSSSWAKLNSFGTKLISVGKQLFKKIDDRLYWFFARESSYRIVKTLGILVGMINIVYSIGTIVQYVVDILDGKWDGYLDTNKIKPKLDLTRDY